MDLNQTKFFEFIQKEIDKSHISQAYFIETKNNLGGFPIDFALTLPIYRGVSLISLEFH